MTEPLVLREDTGGLARLTLNRPERRNALSVALFQELAEHVEAIKAATDSVGCVVLRGAGACFSAGNDLSDIKAGVEPPYRGYQADTIDRLAALPQPVIVAVHGHCLTGALELALAGDLIVAAECASFADTHGKWGMSALWGMTQRLPRRIGRSAALEMMFTGARVSGAEAAASGLADRVVPDEDLDKTVTTLAQSILENSWFSAREAKRLTDLGADLPLPAGLSLERSRGVYLAPDFAERMAKWG